MELFVHSQISTVARLKVWEWISVKLLHPSLSVGWNYLSNFIPHLMMDVIIYPCPSNAEGVPWDFFFILSLQWCHECHALSNHWPLNSLFNKLFRLTSKQHQSTTLLTLGEGNPLVIGGFPSQRASNAEVFLCYDGHHTLNSILYQVTSSLTGTQKLSWCQLWHDWQHQRLFSWQPLVYPMMSNLTLWQPVSFSQCKCSFIAIKIMQEII